MDLERGDPKQSKAARDSFQQRRDEWFRRVIAHPQLRKGAPSVLWFVADHASVRQQGHSWFGHSTIAKGTAMSITAVQRALRSSEQCGLVLIVSHKEQRKPSHYWPILDGQPLAGELPNVTKHRAMATDEPRPSSGENDRSNGSQTIGTSALHIGKNRPPHRSKLTGDLSKYPANDPPKPPPARKREEFERNTVDLVCAAMRIQVPSDPKRLKKLYARIDRVEGMLGCDIERDLLPALRRSVVKQDWPHLSQGAWYGIEIEASRSRTLRMKANPIARNRRTAIPVFPVRDRRRFREIGIKSF